MSEHTVMKMQTTRKRKGQRERHRERQGQRDAKSLHLEKENTKMIGRLRTLSSNNGNKKKLEKSLILR